MVQCQCGALGHALSCAVLSAANTAVFHLIPFSQEMEALKGKLEAKEMELEAAQERVEAAERAVSERDRELSGRVDASAEEVCWDLGQLIALLHCWVGAAGCGVAAANVVERGPSEDQSWPLVHAIADLGLAQRAFCIGAHSDISNVVSQASQAGRELEAARAEVQKIKQQQEAERARVKKAIAEMKRKIDGCGRSAFCGCALPHSGGK